MSSGQIPCFGKNVQSSKTIIIQKNNCISGETKYQMHFFRSSAYSAVVQMETWKMAKTYMRTERMVCREYMGKGVWKIMVLKITAYVIIPVYTLLFVSGTNWMTLNLSVIGNRPERQAAFLGLGLILGFYYHWVLERLLTLLPGKRWEHRILHAALFLLILAVATPYLPEEVPFQAFLHTAFAFTAAVLLLFCLFLTVWRLSGYSGKAGLMLRPFRMGLIAITGISGLLLMEAGIVSTALEVFFILSTTVMVQRLWELSQGM